jgi:phage gpG-like protein
MSGMQVLGIDAAVKRIGKVLGAMSNRKDANARAVAIVDRWVQINFKTEGGNVDGWEPLKDQTIRQRKRNKSGQVKILQDAGWLRGKWKHIISNINGALVSGVDYGIYHDKGTEHLPVRQLLPKHEDIWPDIKKVYSDDWEKAIRG